MNFTFETSVPALTVFFQGLLSFFSPCVLPIVPLYISYFSGGAKTVDADGTIHYPRGRVLLNTLFFVLGISAAFFLLGFGFTALGQFFSDNRAWFARISGIIMILFGLYQLGVFGRSGKLEQEHRLPLRLDRLAMGPLPALLLGFTFSFAWTPCVGPVLGSVLLMAGSTGAAGKAFLLIGVYTLGFVLPFLAVGLFTGTVLDFFKKHNSVVRYTVKIGAVLLILMGIMTLTGFMNGLTSYLSNFGAAGGGAQQTVEAETGDPVSGASESGASEPDTAESESADADAIPAPDFTLIDQFGNQHTLSDYQGKTVFLNFWATWCGPCRSEMPEIQQLYEDYGSNEGDLIVLGVAAPNVGQEGSEEDIAAFLEENGYTFPVVMDYFGAFSNQYGIRAYPTTFMIDEDGNVFGYVESALTKEMMESIVEQTMTGQRAQ
ncbi:MAG: cytochrome C biogenesis protein [Clostridiales bacterium]|nr:MAG: cytochrome C biogenesis protein [Clostridiales bacterium]HJA31125.1 redoxin domain-containing protein [Candidatus Eisenbergiella pullicola]